MASAGERFRARRRDRNPPRACGARKWSFVLFATVVAAAFFGCGRGEPRPPDVIIVLIDTLRADRLGCYGSDKGLTPFLDELAARGTVFSRAYASSSWTLPSVASLFTSRYPSQHQVKSFESKLPEGEVTLAERLAEVGYRAGGFVANFQLERALGYAQGFVDWTTYRIGVGIRAEAMLPAVLQWIDAPPPQKRDALRLLYLHYLEPHSPYDPPEPYRQRFRPSWLSDEKARELNQKLKEFDFRAVSVEEMKGLSALYDGEVASLDDALRATFDELSRRGVLENAIVVITADHGEEFLEHGRFAHGHALYEESVRIPLIFVGPRIAAGHVVDDNVSLVDVAPTLLDLLGLPPQPSFEGRSLVPWMERGVVARLRRWIAGAETEDVLLELPSTGGSLDLRAHSRALLQGSLKLAVALQGARRSEVAELYDLASDPAEKRPNPRGREGDAGRLEASLGAMRETLAGRAGHEGEKVTLDEATKEKLRALGYAP